MSDRDKLIAEANDWLNDKDDGSSARASLLIQDLVAELVRDTPREVSTVAEIAELVSGTMLVDAGGDFYMLEPKPVVDDLFARKRDAQVTLGSGRGNTRRYVEEIRFPATVLFTPTSKETEGAAEIPLEGGTP